ncbi:MAG TPA: DUF1269 domain-containing protein [Polyangia bacterium]|jgi:uncharacterized membrane protein|nr:DUF1269 domain-containing protein [Polyangia bacterium]
MNNSIRLKRWISAAVIVGAAAAWQPARAQGTPPQTLVYATYDSENGAREAFDAMRRSQRAGVINIDSFAVLSKDQRGRVHIQSTQRRGARAGAVVGALVGLLGGPVGVIAGAAAGGGIGYLTGNAVGIPRSQINDIKASLNPGTSAIVAVIDERWVADLEESMRQAKANQVLDQKLANPDSSESKQ